MHAGALGWVAMISIGSLYHLIPKVFGRPQMHSIGLINAHFWLATIGTTPPFHGGNRGSSPLGDATSCSSVPAMDERVDDRKVVEAIGRSPA